MKLILTFLFLLVVVHFSYQKIIVLVKMCKNPILPLKMTSVLQYGDFLRKILVPQSLQRVIVYLLMLVFLILMFILG
ncbi:hypothetical protein [Cytobacillus oceanisediminis]|uniref:Uncharacterized protein n=1 Tax=Cytobacillus oceanisediminis TaxID=665099 RepID=A0A562JJD1_9BACI|nr:hypothetical protein [Cytobacillus oceanisediminis]TWH83024.1 hypothetical protein IQ19_04006 [Cytobacillus oceanisediminis]